MGTSTTDREPLLTDKDVAERTGVSIGTLRNWRYLGTGPEYIKLGSGTVRYRASALDAWLDAHTITPGIR